MLNQSSADGLVRKAPPKPSHLYALVLQSRFFGRQSLHNFNALEKGI